MSAAAIFTALWLGLLTAVSPCPLASNIAAVSFLGRALSRRSGLLAAGLLYAVGRSAAYVALGALLCGGLLSRAAAARFVSQYMNEFIGPVLIVLGLVLLGWLGRNARGMAFDTLRLREKAAKNVALWAAPLGALFALSFCPVSAGLFFGALVPLALGESSVFIIPAVYGAGTAVPVIVFAFILAFFASWLGRAFDILTRVEFFVRVGTGAVFIAVGIFYSLNYVYVPAIGLIF